MLRHVSALAVGHLQGAREFFDMWSLCVKGRTHVGALISRYQTMCNKLVLHFMYSYRTFIHVDCVWNVMAHAQKPDFVFRRNGRVHLNRRGRQFSGLLAAEVCASAVVMLDTPCSEVVWRVLATHSIRQFPLHFPSRVSPCAITFQLDSTTKDGGTRWLWWRYKPAGREFYSGWGH